MKIITNPPFLFCSRKKKALKAMLDIADDYVILATWAFCNNTLRQQELIMPEEWTEVWQTLGISVKHLQRNKEEKPKFYLEKAYKYKEGFYTNMNTHYIDVNAKQYKNLRLEDFTEESLIRKASCFSGGHYFKKGTRRGVYIVPKKDYSKYKDKIFIDSLKWSSAMVRFPLIRQEFVDENNNESSL